MAYKLYRVVKRVKTIATLEDGDKQIDVDVSPIDTYQRIIGGRFLRIDLGRIVKGAPNPKLGSRVLLRKTRDSVAEILGTYGKAEKVVAGDKLSKTATKSKTPTTNSKAKATTKSKTKAKSIASTCAPRRGVADY